jgi:hypothetical protein
MTQCYNLIGGFQLFGGVCCHEVGDISLFRIVSLANIPRAGNHEEVASCASIFNFPEAYECWKYGHNRLK